MFSSITQVPYSDLFLFKCCGILPVCALFTPFQCVSFICLRLIFYSSVNLSRLSVYPWLFFFYSCATSIRPYASSLPVSIMTHANTQLLAAVATDYNKTVINSTAISYRKYKFGFLIHLFGIFCDGKSF